MIEKIIRRYIEKLKPVDITVFARENGIQLTDAECQYLYHIIQSKWEIVVFGNPEPVLAEVKKNVSSDTYKKTEELLYLYREKYKNYL